LILGERTRLRRLERADLSLFTEWLNDPEVRRHLALVYPVGQEQEREWFESTLRLEPACQPFGVEARLEGREPWTLVGSAGFHMVDWRNRCAELGIVLGRRDAWGRKLGEDAMRSLVRWGFDVLGLNRVQLRVFEDNPRAIRCYEKVGFRLEGRLRQDRYFEGRYWDTLVMGVLRGELA
jgi:diamine N-acetyltransferase